MPGAGIEPARYCYHWILSPARLPISPQSHFYLEYYIIYMVSIQDIFLFKLQKFQKYILALKVDLKHHQMFD